MRKIFAVLAIACCLGACGTEEPDLSVDPGMQKDTKGLASGGNLYCARWESLCEAGCSSACQEVGFFKGVCVTKSVACPPDQYSSEWTLCYCYGDAAD